MTESADCDNPTPAPGGSGAVTDTKSGAVEKEAEAVSFKHEFRRYIWQRAWFQTFLAVLVIFLVLSYVLPGVLGLLYEVRSVLVPVLIALALAYIMNPVLRFAEARLRVGRLAGTISLLLLALVLFTVLMVTAVPLMVSQGSDLFNTIQTAWPRYVDRLLAKIEQKRQEEDTGRVQVESDPPPESTPESTPEVAQGPPAARQTADAEAGDSGAAPTEKSEAGESRPVAGDEAAVVDPVLEVAAEVIVRVDGDQPPSTEDGNPGDTKKSDPDASPTTPFATQLDSDEEANEAEGNGDGSLVNRFIDPDRNRRLLEMSVNSLQKLDGSVVAAWAMRSLDIGVGLVGSAISFTTYLALSAIIILFCFFFFSWKFDAILAWFESFIPRSSHDHTLDMLRKMDLAVSSFVRGRVIQSLVMMVVLVIGWLWADVPYWFLLGVITGVMNLVPFLPAVGWIVAVVLTVMATLTTGGDFSFGLIVWPSVVYFVAQGLDGWVVEPFVQGKATNLDPLTVLLVVLIGGTLAGLLGMLLAIPLAACMKILSQEMILPKLRGMAAES